jgi:hypothetical protein
MVSSAGAIIGIILSILGQLAPMIGQAEHAQSEASARRLVSSYCDMLFDRRLHDQARVFSQLKAAEYEPSMRAVIVDRMRPLWFARTRFECELAASNVLAEMDR